MKGAELRLRPILMTASVASLRDRDSVYGDKFRRQILAMGMEEVVISARSPWQNACAERVIGSMRREVLDHVIVVSERHLKRILSRYIRYYNGARTHLSLAKDAPEGRRVQRQEEGSVVELRRVGGLHHEYVRMAA